MAKNVVTTEIDCTVLKAAQTMTENDVGSLPVVDKGTAVGILTERDLVRRVIAKRKDPSALSVREIMSSPIVSVQPSAFVEEAADLMVKHQIRRIIVIENGKLLGIVTSTDLARFVSAHGKFLSALTRAFFEET
ncbi:MAG: CBS domain-containing protein [Thaumarchaeota archaeon]|nr:CBS domain-containing protein [Nitrososphaerota archaeon]